MDQTILGLPIARQLPTSGSYTVSPYAAIAVVKCFDSDGDEIYAVITTEKMSAIEGAGLLKYADVYIEEKMRQVVNASP